MGRWEWGRGTGYRRQGPTIDRPGQAIPGPGRRIYRRACASLQADIFHKGQGQECHGRRFPRNESAEWCRVSTGRGDPEDVRGRRVGRDGGAASLGARIFNPAWST